MNDQRTSDVREEMRGRLAELKRDYRRGETQLQRLMREEAATRDGLLRTDGAIRVLEEILSPAGPGPAGEREGAVRTAVANGVPSGSGPSPAGRRAAGP